MKLLDLVGQQSITAELKSTERNGAIRELVELLAAAEEIEATSTESIIRSIVTRERTRGTTGFGKGVAVPHVKVAGVRRIVAAVGRSSGGIDFGSLDGKPVYTVFLLISPTDQPEEHLKAMDLVFRHLQQEQFRSFMRQSDEPDKIYDLLAEADDKMLAN